MVERGRGHLVFMSSLSGKAAAPGSSVYAATKFGLRGFALGAARGPRADGRRRVVVLPGFIRDAGMFAESGAELPPCVGTKRAGGRRRAVVKAIERNRAELDVAPLAAARRRGPAPAWPRGRSAPSSGSSGATKTADSIGQRPGRQALSASVAARRRPCVVGRARSLAAASSSLCSRRGADRRQDLVGQLRAVGVALAASPGCARRPRRRRSPRARCAARRGGRRDRVLEQRLDVARPHVRAQARAQVDRGGLAQRDDGRRRARRCWGP